MSTKKQAAEGAAETWVVTAHNVSGHPAGSVATRESLAAVGGDPDTLVRSGHLAPSKSAAKPAQPEEQ